MKRYYTQLLFEYLSFFPCVAILGPRQCGKTTFLSELPTEWKRFDLEKSSDYDLAAQDPDLFLRLNPEKIAIDEAQMLPAIFRALRVAIDRAPQQKGRFVITGSSSPQLLRSVSESLAGRIGIIELSPFACAEAFAKPISPFFHCLTHRLPLHEWTEALPMRLTLEEIHRYWLWGGYPEPWIKQDPRFHSVWMEQYLQTYLQRDIARLFPGLDQHRLRSFLRLLAGLSGTVINVADTARALGVSQPTAKDYFEIAHGTFLWRQLFPYAKNTVKRIVRHPKGILRDSGLLHHFLRLTGREELLTHPRMGTSWEGMVIEEILRGLAALGLGHDAYYYRTSAGAEVDLVLEGDFGLVPVEIKYTQTVTPFQLKSLVNFISEQHCAFGIVINNDERVRLYTENIIGIPFACF